MTDQLDERITAALQARADVVATTFEQRAFVAPARRRRPTRSPVPRRAGGGTWRWLVPAGVVSAAIIALVLVFLGGGAAHTPQNTPAGGSDSSAPSRAPSVRTSAATSPASSAPPTGRSSSMPSSSASSSVPGTRTTTVGPGNRGNAHSVSGGRASH